MRDERGRWLPGTSPNPGGRPQGRGLEQEIERKLNEPANPGSQETRLERIANVLVSMAESGDIRAMELILRRLWPEKLELSHELPQVIVRDYTGRSITDPDWLTQTPNLDPELVLVFS